MRRRSLKGICSEIKKFCFVTVLVFKAIKFAPKVINMNRPAPNLQLGLETNYDVNKRFKYSFFGMFYFIFFAITADGKLSIQLPTSYFVPKPHCKLGAGRFLSITLRANLIALNKFQ